MATQAIDYFSATTFNKEATVAGQELDVTPCDLFESESGIAFVHNLESGIDDRLSKADVLYSDLPWEQGFNLFYESAQVEQGVTYLEFLAGIRDEIIRLDKPTLLPIGNKALKIMQPDTAGTVILNRKEVRLALWGIDDTWERINVIDILHDLAETYDTIGDFACGYGRSGRIFVEHGKRFVMSDFNPHCIGFVKQALPKWKENLWRS